jgi:predicted dehydrogenase
MSNPTRVALIGAGQFGQNHARVVHRSPRAELSVIVDSDPDRARTLAAQYNCPALAAAAEMPPEIDAAIVAVPTIHHCDVGLPLLEAGLDVLIEKPIAPDLESASRLVAAAAKFGRILQVGHLERFNPAVVALEARARLPLFFEIHRMSVFHPRSLDVDVVLDLMIHDIDIVLNLVGRPLQEVRAAGIPVLSGKADIANVRLQFEGGCVANLTASRVSTERVRKLRLFQPRQYLSLDYTRQDLASFTVDANRQISFEQVPVGKTEPLTAQFDAFLDSIETRAQPKTSGESARRTLQVALDILATIEEHGRLVEQAMAMGWNR